MPKLRTPDGDIYYEDRGDGEPLVMLRGLGRSIRHWHGFDREMTDSFRVITMDLRGIGRTTRRASYTDTLFHLADDVMAVLDELGVAKAHILGVSLGGMIALACGLRHAERCRSLIVINSSIAGQMSLRISLRGTKTLLQGTTYRRKELHSLLAEVLTGQGFTPSEVEQLAQRYQTIAEKEGMPQFTVLCQLLGAVRFRVRNELQHLQVPTLVMYGTADKFVSPQNSKKLFRLLPNAKLLSIEGGGHELTIDRPQAVRDVVTQWALRAKN